MQNKETREMNTMATGSPHEGIYIYDPKAYIEFGLKPAEYGTTAEEHEDLMGRFSGIINTYAHQVDEGKKQLETVPAKPNIRSQVAMMLEMYKLTVEREQLKKEILNAYGLR